MFIDKTERAATVAACIVGMKTVDRIIIQIVVIIHE